MALPKVTVCGAGAAGTAIAADVALKGIPVTLFELKLLKSTVEEIRTQGGIELTADSKTTSGKTGFARLEKITTDPKEAVEDADGIMITCPAMHHGAFFDVIAPHLKPGQVVLFNTGYWGSLRFARRLRDMGAFDDVTLAETNIMPYLSKRVGPCITKIFNSKRIMRFAAFPGNRTDKAFSILSPTYTEFEKAPNVLWTNIAAGGNQCIHVQLALPIMGYVFDRYMGCKFYTEATLQFARLSAAYDREREPVAKRLGCTEIETGPQWAEQAYGYKGKDLGEAFRKSEHADRYSPLASLDRVLDEDISYAFVPLTRLADKLGLPMPITKGMVEVTSVMLDKDYWKMGVTLEQLGLNGLDADGIMRYAQEGRT